ncbi:MULTISPECIES: hypothetical protein [Bacillaceae]|uniref:Uncharacterized protein n=1 Tax=Alkalicoccobacillus plakortidis TaxID=444060 RepID=A0A9D5DXA0_9BACI|nr:MULTISPECIES: hypothetical protein [Bacillaceae]KQL58890.1 hypothetical protein AN965_02725 [Alkalicoccobacillus plakortidis]
MTHSKRRITQQHPHQLTKQILSIDSALLIASATILGYLVAYRYQMGQFDYYQINEILFGQIYLNHIIIAMTAVFIFIIAILVIQIVLNWYYKQLPFFWSKVASHILPWFLFYPAIAFLYDQSIFYFVPFAIAAYYFIVPLFYGRIQHYKTTFLEKLITPYDNWNWRDYVPSFIKDTKLEKQLLFSIVILILLPQLSFFIGHYLASNQTDYLLFNHEERTHIVLTTTNDSLIVAPFNAEDLTFEQEYTIVPYNGVSASLYSFDPVSLTSGIKPQSE